MAKNIKLTENNAKKSPQGGVLVGKKDGQTIIYDDGKVGGWFVGKTHKEGGIQGIDKTTGQPIEVQTGEVIITAPALADQTPREFQGKMLTNRQILSKINSDAGGVAFAEDGMEIPSKILFKGGSYKYGGKMMSDKEIAHEINKCGCDHDEKKHLSEGMSLEDIAKKHGVTLEELDKQVEIGMEDESIHAGDYKDHFNIVKDHLVESPTFYTDEQKAQGKNENFEVGGDIKSLYENENDYVKHIVESNLTDAVEEYQLQQYLKTKNLSNSGLVPENVRTDPEYIKLKRNFYLAFKKRQDFPKFYLPYKNRDRVQEQKDRKIAQSIIDKIIQIKLKKEKFVKGGEMKKENLVKDAKDGNTPARDLNNYNDMLDVQADGQVGGDSGIYKDGGKIGDWDTNFTSGFNKGQKLSEQEIETIDVYNDFIYGLLFKSGGSFDAKTEETIGLLSITNNPINLAVILEKDPSGFNAEAIKYNQKIKRRLHNLAEKSNRKIVLNNNASSRVNRQFPYLLVSENDAKNYDLANEFYEKLETPRKESRKKLIEELEKEKQGKKEYEYVLTQRPFGIGTYPTENFIRFEDKDYQYGVLVYSQKVPLKDVEHYSLSPITELKEYDDKTLTYLLGKLKIKAKVKLVEDKRKGYFVNVFFYDSEGIQKTQMMSGVNFLKQVQEGKFLNELEKENNYENKNLDELREIHKNKYSNMPIESSKSDDEKLLDKLIAEKFSLMNQEVREKREEKKSFESEGSTEGKGKLYEFFTPQIVADKMLALAQHYGFKGGNVLEPATGSGRLIKNLKNTNITAFEISKDNFEILKREFPNAELYNFNFEKAFLNPPRFNTLVNRKGTETWLKNAPFDLVLANPPYKKEFVTFYSSYFNFKGNLEHFFILQTLYLLKKGGLGVYLIPSSFMRNGIAYNETKKKIFEIAELVDAYRLPSNIFEKTQIGTDILILRKK